MLIRYRKDVVERKREPSDVVEKFIKQVSEDIDQRNKYSYSSNNTLRKSSLQLERIVSILAIIMMAEKCRFHLDDYSAYLYEGGLEEIIQKMKY